MNWIHLAEKRDQLVVPVNMLLSLQVPQKAESILCM